MTNHVKELLSQFSGQMAIVTIPAIYIRFTGSMESAALLSQILYWSDRTKDPDGWFHKSYSEWESEIALSEYQVRKHTKKFTEQGFLQVKLRKINGAPKVHYRVNWDVFSESILKFLRNGNQRNFGNLDSEKTSESIPKKLQNPINKDPKTTNKDYTKPTPKKKEGESEKNRIDSEPSEPTPLPVNGSVQGLKKVPPPPVHPAQRMEDRFNQVRHPWTGDNEFAEWVGNQLPKGDMNPLLKGKRRISNCEQSGDFRALDDYWTAYQSDRLTNPATSNKNDWRNHPQFEQLLHEYRTQNAMWFMNPGGKRDEMRCKFFEWAQQNLEVSA